MKYFLLPISLCMFFVSYTDVVASLTGEEPFKEGARFRILQRGASAGIGEESPKTREDHLVRACSQLRSQVEDKSSELKSAQNKIANLEEEIKRAKQTTSELQSERDSCQKRLHIAIQALGQQDPGRVEELKKQVSVLNMHNQHLQEQLILRQHERDKAVSELALYKTCAQSDAKGYQQALADKDRELKCVLAEIEQLRINPLLIKGTFPIEVALSETEMVLVELTLEQMYFAMVNGKTIYDLAKEQKVGQQEETTQDSNGLDDQEVF